MYSIRTRFKKLKKKMPGVGDIPIFFLAINSINAPRNIRRHFRKCVSPDDYAPNEKEEIIKDLIARRHLNND